MTNRDVVVVGASAGGVEALTQFVRTLPPDLQAAVLVVLHIPVYIQTQLHSILSRAGPLPARLAVDGETLKRGTIYVPPADHHLLIENERVRLTRGPKENRVRPCIDVLFRSAAADCGSRVIGVVLSGALDDGTAGLWAIKDRGGIAIVQNPSDAKYASMPESARKHVALDFTLDVRQMGEAIGKLVNEPIPNSIPEPVPERMKLETKIAIEGNALKSGVLKIGEISPNTCPECHGVLVKIREGPISRYRCHTGHAFSLNTLLADVDEASNDALWNAIRAIEERALILREMEELARSDEADTRAELLAKRATAAEGRAQLIRELVVEKNSIP
jgi:two-component system, chemotaxis family, protein-glutamate methylesterase/glutaminase